MKQLQQEAFFVPLWISDSEMKAPPLCGAIPCHPDHVCETGHRVAARIKSGMNADDWIVAEVNFICFYWFISVLMKNSTFVSERAVVNLVCSESFMCKKSFSKTISYPV